MVADLVHQHMRDDGAERLVMFSPIIEDRPPIEPHHVRELPRDAERLGLREAAAAEQPKHVEFAFGAEIIEHFVLGEILDADDQPFAPRTKILRQLGVSNLCQPLEIGERWRGEARPVR